MPYQQLVLTFPVQDEAKQKRVLDLHTQFVRDEAPDPYNGVTKYRIIKNDNTGIEVAFPQYKKPYHTKSYGHDPLFMWQWFIDKMRGDAARYAGKAKVIFSRDQAAVSPCYLNLAKVRGSRRVVIDYAFKIYGRDENGNTDLRSRYFNVWLHVTYKYNKYEKRHVVSLEDSYVIAASRVDNIDTYVLWLNEIPDLLKVKGLIAPWAQIASFDGSSAQWFHDFQKDYQQWLTKNLLLGIGKTSEHDIDHITAKEMRNHRYYYAGRIGQVPPDRFSWFKSFNDTFSRNHVFGAADLFSARLLSTNDHGIIDQIVGKNVTGRLYPAFYPWAIKLIMQCYEFTDPVFVTQALTYLVGVAKICAHYKDPTVLRHLTADRKTVEGMAQVYGSQIFDNIHQMLENETFSNMPRAKQYRLLYECLSFQENTTVRDLLNMLLTVNTAEPTDGEEVPVLNPRRIRDVKTFHDEVVYVYNALKFKPKKIKVKQYEWLDQYGYEIPNTHFKLVPPEDTNMIRNWGATQRHCIGTYAENMAAGTTILFGVWDTSKDDWFGHLQMMPVGEGVPFNNYVGGRYVRQGDNWTVNIRQFLGKHNCQLDAGLKGLVQNHLQEAVTKYKNTLEALAAAKQTEKETVNG